jgi:elongation factor Ts
VARNADFVTLANQIAELAVEKGVEAAKTEADPLIKAGVLKVGENIQLGEVLVLEGVELDAYIHSNAKFGTIISTEGVAKDVRHDVAMHISAMAPECVDPSEVSEELVTKEKEVWVERLKKENKPAEIAEKIMLGKEAKFRAEKALMTQDFVKNPEQKIKDVVGAGKVIKFYPLAI